ncbi:MAG: hypothetical protein D6706_19395, partial [Chloroflexi bacterium]
MKRQVTRFIKGLLPFWLALGIVLLVNSATRWLPGANTAEKTAVSISTPSSPSPTPKQSPTPPPPT